GGQRARPPGGAAAVARIAGRDDAPARCADPRRAVHPGRPRRDRGAPRADGRSRKLTGSDEPYLPAVLSDDLWVCPSRLLRFARNDTKYAVIARSAATK